MTFALPILPDDPFPRCLSSVLPAILHELRVINVRIGEIWLELVNLRVKERVRDDQLLVFEVRPGGHLRPGVRVNSLLRH